MPGEPDVMLDKDLRKTFHELAESGRRVDRRLEAMSETLEAQAVRLAESRASVDAALRELSRQIGGLGNKFGTFTEGLMYSSLQRILRDRLGMQNLAIMPDRRRLPDGGELEVDMLGWTNGKDNRVTVVEIKSHLTRRDLDQFGKILRRLGDFFPEHKGKTAEGVVAAIGIRRPMADEVQRRGFHLATASDESFRLADTAGFRAARFII